MQHLKVLIIVAVAFLVLGLSACDDDDEGGGGVCVADFGAVVECFDCWDEGDCDDAGYEWHAGEGSCQALGYSNPSGNNCGYTN